MWSLSKPGPWPPRTPSCSVSGTEVGSSSQLWKGSDSGPYHLLLCISKQQIPVQGGMVPGCIVTVNSGSDGLVHTQGHIDRPRGFWGPINKSK